MAEQVTQHSQRLVSQVLIDEWFLAGQRFSRTARGLIIVFLVYCEDLRVQLGDSRKSIFSFPVRWIVRLPEHELATGCVVPEIQPVQNSRAQYPLVNCAACFPCVNTADDEVNLGALLELLNR